MHFVDVKYPKQVEKYNNLLPGRNVMVMFYMDGCYFCDQLKPKWDTFEKHIKSHKKYKDDDKYVIARVNSNYINAVNGDKNILGYPTIMHLLDGKKKSEFEDEREKEQLIKYFEKMDSKQRGGSKKSKRNVSRHGKRVRKSHFNKLSKKQVTKRKHKKGVRTAKKHRK